MQFELRFSTAALVRHTLVYVLLTISIAGLSCEDKNVVETDPMVRFRGAVYRVRQMTDPPVDTLLVPVHLRDVVPLAADLTLDGVLNRRSDSSWFCSFDFGRIARGEHTLRIHSTDVSLPFDTTFVIDQEVDCGTGGYAFRPTMIPPPPPATWLFTGALYRKQLPGEPFPVEWISLPVHMRTWIPVAATITLDRETTVTTTGAWFCAFNFGAVEEGLHTLTIAGTASTAPFETTFTVDRNGICGPDGYSFLPATVYPSVREFLHPQNSGTTWKYQYASQQWIGSTGRSIETSGQHEWSIMSSTPSGPDLTWVIRDIRRDTVLASQGGVPDTNYTVHDTLQFTVVRAAGSFAWDFPSLALGPASQTFPQFHYFGSDTVIVRSTMYELPTRWVCTYISGVGFHGFTITTGGNSPVSESMTLLEMVNP